jgi:glycosyltransferase involved in cell wall biosynthesis
MKPLVSIAIPTYNRLSYLKEATASALEQTYENIEVLIIDDASTDETEKWCGALASRNPKIQYRRNQTNLGLAGNWNALADAARGEYMVLMGDDDRLLPECVEKLVSVIGLNTHVVFSNHYLIDSAGQRLEEESYQHTKSSHRDNLPAGKIANVSVVVWQNSIPVPSMLRTKDVRRLRFKEDINCPEIELFARLANENGEFIFVPEYLAEYRTHPHSATSTGLRGENLAQHLIPLPVPPNTEIYKRQFLAHLLVNAVSRCLERGDRERARRFLRSEYYPTPRRGGYGLKVVLSTCVQGVCAALPAPVGCNAYRLVRRIKRAL